MGLLQKLKSALGLNGSRSARGGRESGDVDVTVEREPSTASEDAVKGTGSSTGPSDTEDEWFDDEDEEETTGDVIDEAESDAGGTASASASTTTDEDPQSLEDVVEEDDDTATEADADATPAASEVDEEDADEEEVDDEVGAADDEPEAVEDDAEATADEAASTEDDSSADADEDVPEGSTDPVTEVSGIGPAYGERLENAGVETVGELAAADAAELSDATDVAQGRVQNWIEAAQEY